MPEPSALAQVVGRRWKYAPPPWRMYQALTDELDRWLDLSPAEGRPRIARSVRPGLVLFRPWIDDLIDHVEVLVSDDGGPGSALRVLATATVPSLSDEDRRRIRHRLGTIFGAELRDWVDEPRY